MIFEVENRKVFSHDIGKSFDKNNHSVILLHGSGQSHVVWSLNNQYIDFLKNMPMNIGKNIF